MAQIRAVYLNHSEAVYLAGYLAQLIQWDAKACVRLIEKERTLGVFGAPPTNCVSFVALPIQEQHAFESKEPLVTFAPETQLDRVVSAGRLRDVLGDVSNPPIAGASRRMQIPEEVNGPIELAMLPPMTAWQIEGEIEAGTLAEGVSEALVEYRNRIDQSNSDQAQAQRVADEIWSRPIVGSLPTRGAHTAYLLGYLQKPDVNVSIAHNRGWTRLVAPSGQVFCPEEFGSLALRLLNP